MLASVFWKLKEQKCFQSIPEVLYSCSGMYREKRRNEARAHLLCAVLAQAESVFVQGLYTQMLKIGVNKTRILKLTSIVAS